MNDARFEALRVACYDIASTTSWKPEDPQSTSLDNVTPKALRYLEIASREAIAHDNPDQVVGAVQYLARHVAIPPLGDDDTWFVHSLSMLMYLLARHTDPDETTRGFLRQLRDAIDCTLQDGLPAE